MDFVKNNLLLILVAFVSGAMLLWPLVRRSAGGPWVDTLGATQMINREDALVLDVREAAEYARGHILGAKSVPLGGAFWDAGAQVFINKGVNGRWRDTLTAADVAAYEARAVKELGEECARWLATGAARR